MTACPSCNFANTEGTKFCVKCGTPLQSADSSPRTSDSSASGGATTPSSDLQPTVYAPPQRPAFEEFPPPSPSSPTPPPPQQGGVLDSGSIPTIFAPYTPASSLPPEMTSGGSGGGGGQFSSSTPSSGGSSPGMASGSGLSGQNAPTGYSSFGNAPGSGGYSSQGGFPPAPGGFASGSPSVPPAVAGASPVNPPLAAIISFFFPGLGLLLVPNKMPLALGIFGGVMVLSILLGVAAGIIGALVNSSVCVLCVLPVVLLLQIGAAIYTYDEAAKLSNGQHKPLVFKK